MQYTFQLTQTPGARKSYRVSPQVKAALKRAAKDVALTEIGNLEHFSLGIVTMTDEELRELNVRSLNHDYYTDILTFEIDRSDSELVAELYFSVDRAKENARKHKQSPEDELILLAVHGVLHLAGHDDHETEARKQMLKRQRFFLAKHRMSLDK